MYDLESHWAGQRGVHIIPDTGVYTGPYFRLVAQGGNVTMRGGTLPPHCSGTMSGLNISNGNDFVCWGITNIQNSGNGNLVAYLC